MAAFMEDTPRGKAVLPGRTRNTRRARRRARQGGQTGAHGRGVRLRRAKKGPRTRVTKTHACCPGVKCGAFDCFTTEATRVRFAAVWKATSQTHIFTWLCIDSDEEPKSLSLRCAAREQGKSKKRVFSVVAEQKQTKPQQQKHPRFRGGCQQQVCVLVKDRIHTQPI